MNTRLQVEHPITEMITKQDLVEWQLKVAAKHPLPLTQDQLKIHGHAFESRIYSENPQNNFMPGTGKLVYMTTPEVNENIRIDTGVRQGDAVSVFYDPMIAKLAVWGPDRQTALQRMKHALEDYKVVGLPTNISFLGKLCSHPSFIAGDVETGFIPKHKDALLPPIQPVNSNGLVLAALSTALGESSLMSKRINKDDPYSPFTSANGKRLNHPLSRTLSFTDQDKEVKVQLSYNNDGSFSVKVPGVSEPIQARGKVEGSKLTAFINDQLVNATIVINDSDMSLFYDGEQYNLKIPVKNYGGSEVAKGSLLSPMPGRILEVMAQLKQKVKKGDPLMVLESMKMQNTIRSPVDGIVEKILFNVNDLVEQNKLLAVITEDK